MSTIDVVIPCYRYAHYLEQCVRSVTEQSVRDVRLLIVDDASPDNTAEVAQALRSADARIEVIRHATNKGHIYTYNEGLEWASSDYLLILSADDFLVPGALERASSLLDAHLCVGFTFGRIVEMYRDGQRSAVTCPIVCDDDAPWCVLDGTTFMRLNGCANIVGAATAVVRTSLQKQVGGYRKNLTHSADMEMWLRFAAHSCVGFVNAVQAVYRRHTENMSLQYSDNSRLPDLIQRKEAIDSFLEGCREQLANRQEVENWLSWQLACDAVSLASAAFNSGDMAVVHELCSYACRMRPDVTSSRQWRALVWKRRIGVAAWRVVRPAATLLRRKATSFAAPVGHDCVHAHAV